VQFLEAMLATLGNLIGVEFAFTRTANKLSRALRRALEYVE